MDDWKSIIWSDKTKVNTRNSEGIKYHWKRKGDPIKEFYLEPTVKHGGGNLMMWGCMAYWGLGYVCQIYDGNMTVMDYNYIMETTLQGSIGYYNLEKDEIVFQKDN